MSATYTPAEVERARRAIDRVLRDRADPFHRDDPAAVARVQKLALVAYGDGAEDEAEQEAAA